MKVIYHGNKYKPSRIVKVKTCGECLCTFRYDENDIKRWQEDIFIECPECHSVILVEERIKL